MSKNTSPRTIIIGDVHGCFDELKQLLRAVKVQPEDQLISVGDLICKGPDSLRVMQWAMATPNLRCVLGNHELRFLNCWRRGVVPDIKPYDRDVHAQMGPHYNAVMSYISSWPTIIEEDDFMVVHGGFDPRRKISHQSHIALTNMRRLKDTQEPWYQLYTKPKLVVFGHWARSQAVVRDNVIGLDTACAHGGALTALILPERRLVSVPAKRAYIASAHTDEKVKSYHDLSDGYESFSATTFAPRRGLERLLQIG